MAQQFNMNFQNYVLLDKLMSTSIGFFKFRLPIILYSPLRLHLFTILSSSPVVIICTDAAADISYVMTHHRAVAAVAAVCIHHII